MDQFTDTELDDFDLEDDLLGDIEDLSKENLSDLNDDDDDDFDQEALLAEIEDAEEPEVSKLPEKTVDPLEAYEAVVPEGGYDPESREHREAAIALIEAWKELGAKIEKLEKAEAQDEAALEDLRVRWNEMGIRILNDMPSPMSEPAWLKELQGQRKAEAKEAEEPFLTNAGEFLETIRAYTGMGTSMFAGAMKGVGDAGIDEAFNITKLLKSYEQVMQAGFDPQNEQHRAALHQMFMLRQALFLLQEVYNDAKPLQDDAYKAIDAQIGETLKTLTNAGEWERVLQESVENQTDLFYAYAEAKDTVRPGDVGQERKYAQIDAQHLPEQVWEEAFCKNGMKLISDEAYRQEALKNAKAQLDAFEKVYHKLDDLISKDGRRLGWTKGDKKEAEAFRDAVYTAMSTLNNVVNSDMSPSGAKLHKALRSFHQDYQKALDGVKSPSVWKVLKEIFEGFSDTLEKIFVLPALRSTKFKVHHQKDGLTKLAEKISLAKEAQEEASPSVG